MYRVIHGRRFARLDVVGPSQHSKVGANLLGGGRACTLACSRIYGIQGLGVPRVGEHTDLFSGPDLLGHPGARHPHADISQVLAADKRPSVLPPHWAAPQLRRHHAWRD